MTSSHAKSFLTVGQVVLCLVGCGCSASCNVGTVDTTASSRQILTDPVPHDLAAAVPTALEIAALPDAPAAGFVHVPLDGAQMTAPPTATTGPCGGPLRQPAMLQGAIAVYTGPEEEVTWWANRLAPGVAHAFVLAFASDAVPGCADHSATTQDGKPQYDHFLGTISLPGIGDESVAAKLRLTSGPGQVAYGTAIAIRRGNLLLLAVTYAAHPIPAAFTTELAQLADHHLAHVPGA